MTRFSPTRRAYAVPMLLAAMGLWLAGAAQAKTINVPTGKLTIQAAINAAVAGDVVVVAPGTYRENIDFKGKAITVRSSNTTSPAVVAATIIDGQEKRSVVTFKSGETAKSVLKGFTVTNGSGTVATLATYPSKAGGGLYCYASSPTISSNVITGNTVAGGAAVVMTFGGGIGCFGASPTISDNTIAGNMVTTGTYVNGAGLGCWGGSPTILNNTVKGNSVAATTDHAGGGGVWCMAASETITGNVISGNQATYCGGGLKVEQETAPTTISGNTISNNSAPRGGGVYSWDSSLTFLNSIVSGNSASIFGGGFKFDEGATVTITNCTISGNSSAKGGGISFTDDNSVTLKNTIIAFSPAGGGLEWHSGDSSSPTAVLSYCDLYGNTGGNYGNWPDQTGKNGNVSKNPLFANVTKGDFHEKSKGGRWNPAIKAWVIDTVHSPCINAGDPASAFALEPTPNGGRINIGAYGNTISASKSLPAAAAGGLLVSAAVAPVSGGGAQLSVNLSAAANVAVTFTNLAGRAVATLPQRDLPPGVSTLLWSGRGATGLRVPSGTYLARLTARTEDGSQGQALATVTVGR